MSPPTPRTWAFGELVTAALLNSAVRDVFNYLLASIVPAGIILPFGGAAAPDGFLLCDGAAVSRSTYSALFTAIGTTWGVGNGTTTFNVPDMRGRTPIGAGTGSGLTARTLAGTLGEETHALTAAEGPVHNHGITDSGHTHFINDNSGGNTGVGAETFAGNVGNGTNSGALARNSTTGITINNAGSGTAHNVMQPSAVVTFIVKT